MTQRHPVVSFFVITFIVSWGMFILAMILSDRMWKKMTKEIPEGI
jgi:hypothetical protein